MKSISLITVILIMLNFSCFAQVNSSIQFSNGRQSVSIPVEIYNNLIFMQCTVNNSKPGWFVFDSGAGITVMDSLFAVSNGIEKFDTIVSKSSGKNVPVVKNSTFSFDSIKICDIDVRIIQTNQLSSVVGKKIDGVIGYDLLSKLTIEVNYANKTLSFFDPTSFIYQGNGEKLPMFLNENHWPLVPAELSQKDNTVRGDIIVDTGGLMALSLSSDQLSENTIIYPISFGINGAGSSSRIGRVGSFRFGNYIVRDAIAGFPAKENTKGDYISNSVSESGLGTIGGDVLTKFTLTFDYHRSSIYIEANKNINTPIQFDMSGMTILTIDNEFKTFMVFIITPGSPAEKLGLQQGDIIIEINGNPASDLCLGEIREIFKIENQSYLLKILRGDEIFETTLITQKMI